MRRTAVGFDRQEEVSESQIPTISPHWALFVGSVDVRDAAEVEDRPSAITPGLTAVALLHLKRRMAEEEEKKKVIKDESCGAGDVRHCLCGSKSADGTCPSACLGESAASL